MEKKLFNFYLDNDIKTKCITKLEGIMGKKEKGAFASLIRVLLKQFLLCDAEKSAQIVEEVNDEYEYSQIKNKRSSM